MKLPSFSLDFPPAEQRSIPADCQQEPPYPGLETVVFALRDPNMTAHGLTGRCSIEHPHATITCGEWAIRARK